MKHPKFIFVIGGVMSSVGKGITSSSIGTILQSRGYRITNVKCDMYVNIDAGTIRPTEHGEVFIGTDGIEADQDLGNYERFTGRTMTALNYITTGQVYQEVIRKERNLEYNGEDVEVVPDVPHEIIRRIQLAQKKNKAEITIVEFGGTIGEYQVLLFLEAARIMKVHNPDDVAFVLVSYLPLPSHIGEMKTKPTQYAVRTLNAAGIMADFIVARAERSLDQRRREILAMVCNLRPGTVLAAPDQSSIYDVPLLFHEQKLDEMLLRTLGLRPRKNDLRIWKNFSRKVRRCKKTVNIGVVGKYFGTGDFTLADSYISVIEAAKHAAWAHDAKPNLTWIDSAEYEKDPKKVRELSRYDGIIVPGGFGSRGIEGVLRAIQYVRENGIPYLGLCYGMQLATIEFAKNVAKIANANSVEIDANTSDPVICVNPKQQKNILEKQMGATMRLGSYPCTVQKKSLAYRAYKQGKISERHRHRYEFNNQYREALERAGMRFSGINEKDNLVEIVELANHPWFVGTQFHPEFQSHPLTPHPLFKDFIGAAIKRQKT
ncbi:CTP synthase [Candidatus Uhrbacteria bacterium]|nr:CTP synthase [Candidatus Uhrbacteria bacterium]